MDFIDDDGAAVGADAFNDYDDDEPPHYVPNPNRAPRQNQRGRPHVFDQIYDLDDDPIVELGRASPRHPVETINIVDSDDNESDWAPRPRHERLAAESRGNGSNNRRHPIVISSDEGSSGSDPDGYDGASGAHAFFSAEEDGEPARSTIAGPSRHPSSRHRVHVISDSEDDTSDVEMYEDAASSTEKTSTSIDRHSPRRGLSSEDDVHHHQEGHWHSDDSNDHDELSSPPLGPYSGLMRVSDEDDNSEIDGYSSGGSLD